MPLRDFGRCPASLNGQLLPCDVCIDNLEGWMQRAANQVANTSLMHGISQPARPKADAPFSFAFGRRRKG